jgi:hypothetical protein
MQSRGTLLQPLARLGYSRGGGLFTGPAASLQKSPAAVKGGGRVRPMMRLTIASLAPQLGVGHRVRHVPID